MALWQLADFGGADGCLGRPQFATTDPFDQGGEMVDFDRLAKQTLQWRQGRSVFLDLLTALRVPFDDRLDGLALSWVECTIRLRHQHFI